MNNTAVINPTPIQRNIHINIHDKDYDVKPSSIVIGQRKNRKTGNSESVTAVTTINNEIFLPKNNRILSCNEFVDLVTRRGHAFTPSVFGKANPDKNQDGGLSRKQECVSELALLAVDFDNDPKTVESHGYVTWEDILQRAQRKGINVWLIYPSFSYSEARHKFRLVCKLDTPITDWRAAKAAILAFNGIFPEADKACKSLGQVFFGCNAGPLYRNDSAFLDVEHIFQLFFGQRNHDKHDNRARDLKAYCKACGVQMGRYLPMIASLSDINIKKDDGSDANVYIYQYNRGQNVKKLSFTCDVSEDDMRYGKKRAATSSCILQETKPHGQKRGQRQSNNHYTMKEIRDYSFDEASMHCRLLREAISGSHWLTQTELCLMLSNLMYIRSGMTKMDQILHSRDGRNERLENDSFVDGSYEISDRKYQFCDGGTTHIQFRNQGMSPWSCESRCPFFHQCGTKRILNAGKGGKLFVTRMSNDETVSLSDTRGQLPDVYREALASDSLFNAIRVDVGTGKTYTMQDVMIEEAANGKRVIYAASTYLLGCQTETDLRDKLDRYSIANVAVYRFADIRTHLPEDLKSKTEFLYRVGAYEKAAAQIRDWINKEYTLCMQVEEGKWTTKAKDIIAYKQSTEALRDSGTTNCIIILTHARYVNCKNVKADVAFIDEDILMKSLIRVQDFKLFDLKKLSDKAKEHTLKGAESLEHLVSLVEGSSTDMTIPMPSVHYHGIADDLLELISSKKAIVDSKVIDFLTRDTEAFQKSSYHGDNTIFFASKQELPKIKTIIASATINQIVYERFFGDPLRIWNLPLTELQGRLLQYPSEGFSNNTVLKSYMRNEDSNKIVNDFKSYCEGKNVICTKEVAKLANNAGIQFNLIGTYGSLEGLNSYSGVDIVLFGMLHQPPVVYSLFAYVLNQRTGIGDSFEKTAAIIERNNFRFSYNAMSDDPLLREIQFYHLEEPLIQAVGRARLVLPENKNTTVTVYSNLPLPPAIIQ
ncbi:hypothetical protein [Paenibacillus sp. P46E]|uniref:hypothetical protein n=1 Tax=Paenibacillus sp. P46E TaxID=1349436 RepID=UPI00093CFCFC|nr:hypothetical protein [Paenibacillus sp. P46E]OKP99230.1 hypothetical protein A3849_06055 [Paenibacillus sp. P46E]